MKPTRLSWVCALVIGVVPSLGLASTFTTATSSANFGIAQGLATGASPNRFANIRFELHATFVWYGGVGGGGRVEFPLARNGIIEGVDDELALSVGAELYFFYAPGAVGIGVFPMLALQWNFYLSNVVSIFPELGLAFLFGPSRDRYWGAFIAPYLGLGLRLHFTARNAVLFRVGWPAGLQIGITF